MKLSQILKCIFILAALNFSAAAFALEFISTTPEDGSQTYVLISGEFSDAKTGESLKDAKEFDDLMAKLIKQPHPIAIYLTSSGGTLDSTVPLAKLINHWSNVYFEARKKPMVFALMIECSSACTFLSAELHKLYNPKHLVFLAPADTTMHLHGPVNMDTGLDMERKEDFKKFLEIGMKAYSDAGVSRAWLKKNESIFKSSRGKSFTAQQLCREKSGVLPPIACVRDHSAVAKKITELEAQRR